MTGTSEDTQPSGISPEGIVGFPLARIADDEEMARGAMTLTPNFEKVRKEAAREVIAAKREAREHARREIKGGGSDDRRVPVGPHRRG